MGQVEKTTLAARLGVWSVRNSPCFFVEKKHLIEGQESCMPSYSKKEIGVMLWRLLTPKISLDFLGDFHGARCQKEVFPLQGYVKGLWAIGFP